MTAGAEGWRPGLDLDGLRRQWRQQGYADGLRGYPMHRGHQDLAAPLGLAYRLGYREGTDEAKARGGRSA